MRLVIYLKNGTRTDVENLEKIALFSSPSTTTDEVTDFNNFFVLSGYQYSFQGKNTVVIDGNEILYLDFKKL